MFRGNNKEHSMHRTILAVTGAAVIVSAASLMPAKAMTVGTVPGIEAALAETDALHEVPYVCRHRFYTSRRLCWWRPAFGYRGWRWRRRS
jgi:hypothetical protein